MEDKKRFHSHFSLLTFSFHYTWCCKNISHALVTGYRRMMGEQNHWNPRKRYYATALRLGTAETEAILRRFTRTGLQHPTYRALLELGKAVKTIFLCRYLESEALRREIHKGLNVIENWNGATAFIFYGHEGDFQTNRL